MLKYNVLLFRNRAHKKELARTLSMMWDAGTLMEVLLLPELEILLNTYTLTSMGFHFRIVIYFPDYVICIEDLP